MSPLVMFGDKMEVGRIWVFPQIFHGYFREKAREIPRSRIAYHRPMGGRPEKVEQRIKPEDSELCSRGDVALPSPSFRSLPRVSLVGNFENECPFTHKGKVFLQGL